MTPESSEPLRLDQFLKLTGLAATGGHAKILIQQGSVSVNGEQETRRRRKLVQGDIIQIDGESFVIGKDFRIA